MPDTPAIVWERAIKAASNLRIPADPSAEGPAGIYRGLAEVARIRGELTADLGRVMRHLANLKRRLLRARHDRKFRADGYLANAHNDVDLRRATATAAKAKVAMRLVAEDDVVTKLEEGIEEWGDLRDFLKLCLDHAKQTKEAQRSQVDVLLAQRGSMRGDDFESPHP